MVKALKLYFLYTIIDIVIFPKGLYKTHLKKAQIFAVDKKVTK